MSGNRCGFWYVTSGIVASILRTACVRESLRILVCDKRHYCINFENGSRPESFKSLQNVVTGNAAPITRTAVFLKLVGVRCATNGVPYYFEYATCRGTEPCLRSRLQRSSSPLQLVVSSPHREGRLHHMVVLYATLLMSSTWQVFCLASRVCFWTRCATLHHCYGNMPVHVEFATFVLLLPQKGSVMKR